MKEIVLKLCLYVAAMTLLIFSFGCSTSKHINKSKTTEDKITDLVTAFSSTVTETIDTVITVKSATITAEKDLDYFIAGDTIKHEDNDLTIISFFDRPTNKIHVKAVRKKITVPVEKKKTTVSNGSTIMHEMTKTKTLDTVKNVERKWSWFNWLWLLLLLIPLAMWKYRAKIWKWVVG